MQEIETNDEETHSHHSSIMERMFSPRHQIERDPSTYKESDFGAVAHGEILGLSISLRIPYTRSGSSSNGGMRVLYVIRCTMAPPADAPEETPLKSWEVGKRYSDFVRLNNNMLRILLASYASLNGVYGLAPLPPRHLLHSPFDRKVIAERKVEFLKFLQSALTASFFFDVIQPELAKFLECPGHSKFTRRHTNSTTEEIKIGGTGYVTTTPKGEAQHGFLYKHAGPRELFKPFRLVFCVLRMDDGVFRYYRPSNPVLLGEMRVKDVYGKVTELGPREFGVPASGFGFSIWTAKREFIFYAETHMDRELWMNSFKSLMKLSIPSSIVSLPVKSPHQTHSKHGKLVTILTGSSNKGNKLTKDGDDEDSHRPRSFSNDPKDGSILFQAEKERLKSGGGEDERRSPSPVFPQQSTTTRSKREGSSSGSKRENSSSRISFTDRRDSKNVASSLQQIKESSVLDEHHIAPQVLLSKAPTSPSSPSKKSFSPSSPSKINNRSSSPMRTPDIIQQDTYFTLNPVTREAILASAQRRRTSSNIETSEGLHQRTHSDYSIPPPPSTSPPSYDSFNPLFMSGSSRRNTPLLPLDGDEVNPPSYDRPSFNEKDSPKKKRPSYNPSPSWKSKFPPPPRFPSNLRLASSSGGGSIGASPSHRMLKGLTKNVRLFQHLSSSRFSSGVPDEDEDSTLFEAARNKFKTNTLPTRNPHVLAALLTTPNPWKGRAVNLMTAHQFSACLENVYYDHQSLRQSSAFRPKNNDLIVTSVARCGVTPILLALDSLRNGSVVSLEELPSRVPWLEQKEANESVAKMFVSSSNGNRNSRLLKTTMPLRYCLGVANGAAISAHSPKVVVVLRDPLDLKLSWFRHCRRVYKKLGKKGVKLFDGKFTCSDFAQVPIPCCNPTFSTAVVPNETYEAYIREVLHQYYDGSHTNFNRHVHIVFYEELLADCENTIRKLANFVDCGNDEGLIRQIVDEIQDSEDFPGILNETTGQTRFGSTGAGHRVFTRDDIERIDDDWDRIVRAHFPQFELYGDLYEAFTESPYPHTRSKPFDEDLRKSLGHRRNNSSGVGIQHRRNNSSGLGLIIAPINSGRKSLQEAVRKTMGSTSGGAYETGKKNPNQPSSKPDPDDSDDNEV